MGGIQSTAHNQEWYNTIFQVFDRQIKSLLSCSNESFQLVIGKTVEYRKKFNELRDFSEQLRKSEQRQDSFLQEQVGKKIALCLEEIDHLVTNLQFQDIIRQKLEHIGEVHEMLRTQLQPSAPDSVKFTARAVLGMHQEILRNCAVEYQLATAKAFECLVAINQETNLISIFCLKSSNDSHRAESEFYRQLFGKVVQISELVNKLSETDAGLSGHVANWKSKLDRTSARIEEAQKVKQLIGELIGEAAKAGLQEASKQLLRSLHAKTEELEQINKALTEAFANEKGGQYFEKWASSLKDQFDAVNLEKEIDHLKAFDRELHLMLNEAYEASQKLSDSLQMLTKQIKQADIFTGQAEVFIQKLAECMAELPEEGEIQSDMLELIRVRYTMESEREIFDHAFKHYLPSKDGAVNENQDIELF